MNTARCCQVSSPMGRHYGTGHRADAGKVMPRRIERTAIRCASKEGAQASHGSPPSSPSARCMGRRSGREACRVCPPWQAQQKGETGE